MILETVQPPVVVDSLVPIIDIGFSELPARYQTLNVPLDVLGSMAQLASWFCLKLPTNWRQPIHIAGTDSADAVDDVDSPALWPAR